MATDHRWRRPVNMMKTISPSSTGIPVEFRGEQQLTPMASKYLRKPGDSIRDNEQNLRIGWRL